MNRSNHPSSGASEHVWLRRSQWRTVAALLLLLATVVVSLALVAGFWWTVRPRQTAVARRPEALAAASVATVTLPVHAPSVVEVYGAMLVQPRAPAVALRSPGGKVMGLTVHVGQWVKAGQALVQMAQVTPAPATLTPATVPRSSLRPVHSANAVEAARLRRRLAALQPQIAAAQAAVAAAARPGPEAARVPPAARTAAAQVERARQALAAATERRLRTDARYEAHLVNRFQFHLARSGELVAQVVLREAEERAGGVRQASDEAVTPASRTAVLQAERHAAILESEARRVADRLARVTEQVAAAREQIPPPAPTKPALATRAHAVTARAPRTGVVTAVWARAGETLPRGAPLLVLAQQKRPFLVAHVGREARSSFSPGQRVTIRRREGQAFVARVTRVIREKDGTGIVEARLPRPFRLEPGAVLVPPHPRSAAPVIPAAAVRRTRTEAAVWIAVPRGDASAGWIAHHQVVRVAAAGRNRVALLAGVHPGERVIVAGVRALHEGQPVAPVDVDSLQAEP